MTAVWWLVAGTAAFGMRGAAAVGAIVVMRRVAPRRKRRSEPVDLMDFVTLATVAVRAGLPLGAALAQAGAEIGGEAGSAVEELLRLARLKGLAMALAETSGPLGSLAAQLARAQVTGSSVAAALEAHLATIRADERARLSERARTLPIRLILPVSLLLLPGFIALVLGPVILEQLAGLNGVTGP